MIVMKNVFAVNLRIHKKYDLKGSKVDRAATDKDPTLKDCDFLNEEVLQNLRVMDLVLSSTILALQHQMPLKLELTKCQDNLAINVFM